MNTIRFLTLYKPPFTFHRIKKFKKVHTFQSEMNHYVWTGGTKSVMTLVITSVSYLGRNRCGFV